MKTDREHMKSRILTEISALPPSTPHYQALRGLADFLEKNTSALSPQVAEYINRYDTPLATVHKMLTEELKGECLADYYSDGKDSKIIKIIEHRITEMATYPEECNM